MPRPSHGYDGDLAARYLVAFDPSSRIYLNVVMFIILYLWANVILKYLLVNVHWVAMLHAVAWYCPSPDMCTMVENY